MPTIWSIAAPASGGSGRLRTLDLLEQREPGLVEDRQHALEQGAAGLPDGQAQSARTQLPGDLDLRQEEREPFVVRAAGALRRPVIDARAHDADAPTGGGQAVAEDGGIRLASPGEGAPQPVRAPLRSRR